MNKIVWVSRFFKYFFQCLFVSIFLSNVIGWIYAPNELALLNHMITFNVIPNHYPILHTLTITEKLLGFTVSLVPITVTLVGLAYLTRLFSMYAQGNLFDKKNVIYIKRIAYALIISQIINPFYQLCMGFVLTKGNPIGHRVMSITLDQTNIALVLLAGLIIVIAWMTAEGFRLREEQQLTI